MNSFLQGFVITQSCITLPSMPNPRALLPALLFAMSCISASAQTLTDGNGETLRLGDLVGGGDWVMVNVWSPGCSHCVRELPALIKFHADNPAGARVIGIAVAYPGFGAADPVALDRFVTEHGINFPNFATDGVDAGAFLGETVDLVPVTYAYDPRGQLVARWHGVITERDLMEIISDFSPAAQ